MVCLDASIIVKLLTREKDSGKAAALFDQLVSETLPIIEPTFLKVEVYSTLRKKSYLKELSKKKTRTALDFFDRLPLEYIPEDNILLDRSLALAEKLSLPVVYDCLYLALAEQEKTNLITADERFLRKAKGVYKSSFLLKEMV